MLSGKLNISTRNSNMVSKFKYIAKKKLSYKYVQPPFLNMVSKIKKYGQQKYARQFEIWSVIL